MSATSWVFGIVCIACVIVVPFVGVWWFVRRVNSGIIGWKQQQRQVVTQAGQSPGFAAWAAQRGMTYVPRDDRWTRLSPRWPFIGEDPHAEHVFVGTVRGRPLAAFQYTYMLPEQSGIDQRRKLCTAVALRLPAARPNLVVSPVDEFGQRLHRHFGMAAGQQFEDQRFNERFFVYSDNPRFASDVLDPRMMEWMTGDPDVGHGIIVMDGAWLLVWYQDPMLLERLDSGIRLATEFADRISSHVWSE